MKNLILLLMLVATTSVAFAQKSKSDTLTVKTKIYCDHCKECSSCQPQIEQDLRFTKGVKLSIVNVANQTITIIYNPAKTNPEAIRKAIANSGYDADDVKADVKAYSKLDGCCKKSD